MASVVLENVHKNYGAPADAVKDANFRCDDGELLVLLGPSGCGKTTTLRMIAGLETITSGTIRIGDRVVNDLSPQERNVAMAFETYALYPPLTVYENIAFPLQVMGWSKQDIRQRVLEVAEELSITDTLNHRPENLAGGEKQRVSLARALVREPTVFLMDEPLSHVDADVRHRARATVKHLHVSTGATVIYVTHDQVEAVALADRVVVMDLGVIQQIGPPLDLFHRPANLFVAEFIGEPPMNTVDSQLSLSEGMVQLEWPEAPHVELRFEKTSIDPDLLDELATYDGEELVVGVRPQHIKLQPADADDSFGTLAGELLIHEFLGEFGVSQVQVGETMVECITEPDVPFGPGDAVQLKVSSGDVHFFDKLTRRRIG